MACYKLRVVHVGACLVLASHAQLEAASPFKRSCAERSTEVDMSISHTNPETRRGPIKATFTKLNTLRYDISLGNDVQLSDGPDLRVAGFIPQMPAAPEEPPQEEAAPSDPRGGPEVESVEARNDRVQSRKVSGLQGRLDAVRERLSDYLAKARGSLERLERRQELLAGLVEQSNGILAAKGGEADLAGATRRMADDVEKDLAGAEWPDEIAVRVLQRDLRAIQEDLARLPERDAAFNEWTQSEVPNYLLYESTNDDAQALSLAVSSLEPSSDQRKAYEDIRKNLEKWLALLRTLDSEEDFRREVSVTCEHPFFRPKTVTFEVTRRDRTVQAVTKEKPILVECPSVASVTGGVGVSGLDDRGIMFVPSSETDGKTVSKFGFEDRAPSRSTP